jgi:hypothetical protein
VLHTYAEAGHLDQLSFHAGDSAGTLTGTRLDEVGGLDLNGVHFTPGELSRAGEKDALKVNAAEAGAAKTLSVTVKTSARVTLKDGRILNLPTSVQAARPQISLMSKTVEADTALASSNLHLASPDELPLGGRISFFLKTIVPASFPRTEKIEVAAADGSFHTLMDLDDGSLLLQDAATMLGTLDPLKSFGPSAFGAIQLRAVDASGAKSVWQPLGTLVRLPVLSSLHCPKLSRPSVATSTAPPVPPAASDNAAASPGEKGGTASSPAATPSPASATPSGAAATPAQSGSAGAAPAPQPNDTDAQCTLAGSSLFLIDAVGSDAQFAHSITVPDGFNGTALSVPRPLNGQLFVRLRDDTSAANTYPVPAGSLQSAAHGGDLPGGGRRMTLTQQHSASMLDEDSR